MNRSTNSHQRPNVIIVISCFFLCIIFALFALLMSFISLGLISEFIFIMGYEENTLPPQVITVILSILLWYITIKCIRNVKKLLTPVANNIPNEQQSTTTARLFLKSSQ